MMEKTMFGVVLWADKAERTAIIWCEDHGDLAFYRSNDSTALTGVTLDAGDLIQFEVTQSQQLRYAKEPRLLARQKMPALADDLLSETSRSTVDRILRSAEIDMTLVGQVLQA